MILFTDFSVTSLLDSYLTRVHSLVCLVEGFMFIFFLLCRIIIQQIELVQLFFFLQNLMWFNMSKIYKNKFDVWYVADTKTGSILSQIYINWTVMIHDINDICLTICDHTIYGVPPEHAPTALLVCYYWIQNKLGNSSQFIICQHRINIQINVNVYMTKAQTC